MLELLITAARFPHIIRILTRLRHPAWIVTVVINHATEDRISMKAQLLAIFPPESPNNQEKKHSPHPLIHIHRDLIPRPNIQIHKPSVINI